MLAANFCPGKQTARLQLLAHNLALAIAINYIDFAQHFLAGRGLGLVWTWIELDWLSHCFSHVWALKGILLMVMEMEMISCRCSYVMRSVTTTEGSPK